MMSEIDYDIYRIQEREPIYRRKWQVEWVELGGDYCDWAARGYTRSGALFCARLRATYPRLNRFYGRVRVMIRRNLTSREWYAPRYDVLGRTRPDASGRPRDA